MNKQIKIGAILQYAQMFFSVLISLVCTPLLLTKLGTNGYGLYNLSSSIISYLSLFSLGLGSSYIKFYSLYKKDKPEKIKNLNGLYVIVFSIIGIISLGAGIVLSLNSSIFLNASYSGDEIESFRIMMFILTVNISVSFPFSVFSSYIISQEKFIFQKLLNLGKTVLSPIVSLCVVLLGYGSVGFVLTTAIFNLIVDLMNIFYCLFNLKMKIAFKQPEFGVFKDIFVFSIFIAINQIVDQINWQTDKVILGKMINGAAVSVYAIGSTLNNYYVQFSTAISSLFVPKINRIIIENKLDVNTELTELMVKVGRIQMFILTLVLTGFLFFGKFFVLKWAGEEYGLSYYVALILMIPETVPLIQNIAIEIQRAKNMHKFRSIVYLFMALINVIISVCLCYYFGIIGVTIGTFISILVANIFIMNIYYHKKLKLNMLYFWKKIFESFIYLMPCILLGCIFLNIQIYTFYDFIRYVIFYVFIYLFSAFTFFYFRKGKNK